MGIVVFVMLKTSNGEIPLPIRIMGLIFATVLCVIGVRELFAASMEDTFQTALTAIVSGQAIKLDRDDSYAFRAWIGWRRATHLMSMFTLLCLIPFSVWWARVVQKHRNKSDKGTS